VTAVASVAAVAAAARVFVFSRAFSGSLGFSRGFLSFLWSSRAFSSFLGFPVLLGNLRGPFGYLRGPFVSFGVPLGVFGLPLECPRASSGPFGIPEGSPWGPFGVPLGSLWSLWGHLDCPGVPKDAEKQKTCVFVCFCACVQKHEFLCVFLESAKGPCNKTHVFLCVFVLSSTFEAEVASS